MSSLTAAERHKRNRSIQIMVLLTTLIVVLFVISMNTGFTRLAPLEVIQTLFGGGTNAQSLILFEFRMPRIIISVLAGAGLAVSGCIIQSVTRSALADPGILGINAGAGLAIVLFLSFFQSRQAVPVYMLPMAALIGAAAAAILIYALALRQHQGFSSTRLLLTGIAVASGISALMVILTLKFDPNQYQFVSTWLAGTIWGSNWHFVLALLPWVLVLFSYVLYHARTLDLLQLDEPTVIGLGVAIEKNRRMLLLAAVALAAACVAVSGGIGFIGLIAPHLARRLVGAQHLRLLPVSALSGALLLLAADTLGRWMLQPAELPAGIIVSVLGAPYFLYLLSQAK
ncbi:FecCD family ABC transporter permease [Sporolactobacillus terrae]|uniref:FecCD family ABC transporter permease n=1 Tax=Sporolactobacillus terrae TaxID=269673 RepID=UPI0011185D76|nr:iron ABC transporter permease [Sporolactobacillus terrae]